jgi:ribonuclease HI
LESPKGEEFLKAVKLSFKTSNNESEYEALVAGLRWALEKGITSLSAHVDSLLVANQLNE